jgi:hypothetical protein
MQEDNIDLIERYAKHIHQVCYADRKPVQQDLGKFDGRYLNAWQGLARHVHGVDLH